MNKGQISNKAAPTIAIRIEDFLLKYKNSKFRDKLLNKIIGAEIRADFNPGVISFMNFIFRHTDMTVDLVIESRLLNKEIINKLVGIPYNRIISIVKPVQVAIMLNTKDFTYYVDDDEERRSIIGHKYCVSLLEMNSLISRGL